MAISRVAQFPSKRSNRDRFDHSHFWGYKFGWMNITFDPEKRDRTLDERGLDFADAAEVFGGPTFDLVDDRKDYGETRIRTAGHLRGRMVMVVWTPRGNARHIISMRKANDRERESFRDRLGKG
jgi:uncharacterized protein